MKLARPLQSFRKDLKRAAKRGWDLRKIHRIISLLQENATLPPTAKPHRLSGEWDGFWECHIESDWLLIYGLTEAQVLLVRTGTHADLFE